MKLIVAIIKPCKLDDVTDAVIDMSITGLTVTEVRGFGRQKGHLALYKGAEYLVDLIPKIRIDLLVDDHCASKAVEAVRRAAYTGHIGDGKIFVSSVEEVVRIRTNEVGVDAI